MKKVGNQGIRVLESLKLEVAFVLFCVHSFWGLIRCLLNWP